MYSLRERCIDWFNNNIKIHREKVWVRKIISYILLVIGKEEGGWQQRYMLRWESIQSSYMWQHYIQWPKKGWRYWVRVIGFIVLNGVGFLYFIRWGLQTKNPICITIYIFGVGLFILCWTAGIVRYIFKHYIKLPKKRMWRITILIVLIFLIIVVSFYLTHTLAKFICKRFRDLPLYLYYDWTFYEWEKFFMKYYKSYSQMSWDFTVLYIYTYWGFIFTIVILNFILLRHFFKYSWKPYWKNVEIDFEEQRKSVLLIIFLVVCITGVAYVLCEAGLLKPVSIYLVLKKGWKIATLGYLGIQTTLYHYLYLGCIKFAVLFLFTLIILLLLTLIIATITLIERKILALVQRRVGPNYIGYKGRFQFIADALKLLVKHIVIFSFTNRVLFMLLPILVLVLCYLFWINLIWGPNLALCEIEYNLLFMGILSLSFSLLLFLIGWLSKNKYAILSSNRVIVVTLNLEIFLNFILLFLLVFFESFSFLQITAFQSYGLWGYLLLLPFCPVLIITFLLETGRIPFDLGEAESELIAGYTTEMGGFFFALFYLGEYFHLFCFAAVYILCFFGGWYLF